jgi:hypothetical protein
VLLEELPNSTVITVAHRLSNITHFHRVLVIGKLLGLLQYPRMKLINFGRENMLEISEIHNKCVQLNLQANSCRSVNSKKWVWF